MRIRRPAQTKILKCFNLQTERACKQSFAPLLTKPGIIVEVNKIKAYKIKVIGLYLLSRVER